MATGKSTPSVTPTSASKERRLRQWAARIVSDLPPDDVEASRVLKLAGELRRSWLGDAK
jgi:hypothetical protein